MGHHHGHDHAHHHSHHTSNKTVLFWSFIVIFTFMIVEAIGGYLTNSLALLSDAGHMLSDAAALGLSLLAFKIGERKANQNKTFGYKRFEIIAAFINGITLIAISLYIFYEAVHRFVNPPTVSASMMFIAIIGFIVNIVVAWLLMRGDSKENLNIRSALFHVLGDLFGSVGAIIAGILIYAFGWYIADPIASVIVAFLIIISGIRITKEASHVLMEGKPKHIDADSVFKELLQINGVTNIHDLHIWSITSEFPTLSCHIVVTDDINRDELLFEANHLIKSKFGIKHSTLQIEGENSINHSACDFCD